MRLALISSAMKFAGKKASLRASSIGPIRDMTPRTVIYRYYHYNCSIIPKTVYSDWGYCLAILARVRTLWAHASTLGRTRYYSPSLSPRKSPRYRLPSM